MVNAGVSKAQPEKTSEKKFGDCTVEPTNKFAKSQAHKFANLFWGPKHSRSQINLLGVKLTNKFANLFLGEGVGEVEGGEPPAEPTKFTNKFAVSQVNR